MNNENYSPYLKIKEPSFGDNVLYTEYASEFESLLQAKLRELFDFNMPFMRCDISDNKSCEYCDFKTICKR